MRAPPPSLQIPPFLPLPTSKTSSPFQICPSLQLFTSMFSFPKAHPIKREGEEGLNQKLNRHFWRTGFCAVFSIAFSFVFGPSRRRADINDTWTIRLSGSYLWRAKSGCARRRISPVSKNTCSFVALRWQWRYLVFFLFYFFILVIPLVQGSDAKSQKFKIKNKPCLTMIEITCRIDIPDNVLQHPIIQALLETANDIVCFTNVRKYLFPTWEVRIGGS